MSMSQSYFNEIIPDVMLDWFLEKVYKFIKIKNFQKLSCTKSFS